MIYLIIFLAILILDMLTKYWGRCFLSTVGTIPVIQDVFHLTYVENFGAAFGIFQNGRVFFIVISIIVLLIIGYVCLRYKRKSVWFNLALSFLSAGAVGNMIDRIALGFVTDIFDFRLINFPVFNVADIFVCIGAGLLSVYLVFLDEKDSNNKKESKVHED